jgi:hypothetical protein
MTAVRSHIAAAAAVVLALGALTACQRKEAPTPGVAGGTANPPAATGSAPTVAPSTGDAQVGRGKSPDDTQSPQGTTGQAGVSTIPGSAAQENTGLPAIPPATAPGTALPVPPASAPASR